MYEGATEGCDTSPDSCDESKKPTCVAVVGVAGNATVCNPAAPVRKEPRSIKRSWLIDTGCPFDLAAAGDLQEDDFIVAVDNGLWDNELLRNLETDTLARMHAAAGGRFKLPALLA